MKVSSNRQQKSSHFESASHVTASSCSSSAGSFFSLTLKRCTLISMPSNGSLEVPLLLSTSSQRSSGSQEEGAWTASSALASESQPVEDQHSAAAVAAVKEEEMVTIKFIHLFLHSFTFTHSSSRPLTTFHELWSLRRAAGWSVGHEACTLDAFVQ